MSKQEGLRAEIINISYNKYIQIRSEVLIISFCVLTTRNCSLAQVKFEYKREESKANGKKSLYDDLFPTSMGNLDEMRGPELSPYVDLSKTS